MWFVLGSVGLWRLGVGFVWNKDVRVVVGWRCGVGGDVCGWWCGVQLLCTYMRVCGGVIGKM